AKNPAKGWDVILRIVYQIPAMAEIDQIRIALAESDLGCLAPERVAFVAHDNGRAARFTRLHVGGDIMPDNRSIMVRPVIKHRGPARRGPDIFVRVIRSRPHVGIGVATARKDVWWASIRRIHPSAFVIFVP